MLVPLRGAFDDAVRDGLVAVSPLSGIENLSHRARDPDPLAPDEINALLAVCDGAILNLFQFAIWTGLRASELIALHWFEVDLKRGVLTTGRAWETDGQVRKTAWAPAVKRAGIRYRCAYQTRHTYASLMLSAGENPLWVASQMGHRDWGMIRKVYGRWIPETDPLSGSKAVQIWAQVGHRDRQSA